MDTSLSLLARLARPGDGWAWSRLVDIYTPVLRGWLRRYDDLSAADVDDLVQDVLLAVSKEIPKFQPAGPGAFRGWLRVILVNRLRDFWRSRQRRPRAVGGSEFLDQLNELGDAGTPASHLWDRDHDRSVAARLMELARPRFAPETWQAFRRQVVDGASAETVSAELAMPLHSVYAAKSRVLRTLRSMADGMIT